MDTYGSLCDGKEQVLDWAQILTFNILKNAHEAPEMKKLGFHMSAYLNDVVCSSIHFLYLGWEWNPTLPLVHIYCS
jgi:hypothetical protein